MVSMICGQAKICTPSYKTRKRAQSLTKPHTNLLSLVLDIASENSYTVHMFLEHHIYDMEGSDCFLHKLQRLVDLRDNINRNVSWMP